MYGTKKQLSPDQTPGRGSTGNNVRCTCGVARGHQRLTRLKNITERGVSRIRYRDLGGSVRSMPRPRKGDRVELLTRPERIVSDTIKQQAAARGMSVSQYVADLLAIQAGYPELVRELDKEVLPLAM